MFGSSTQFLRKYNDLLSCDTPYNSLPLLVCVAVFVLVNINLSKAIYIEFENVETSLSGLIDLLMNVIVFSCTIRRVFNKRETTELIDVIENELELDRTEFEGRERTWMKIEKTHRKRKEHAERMAKNLFIVMFLLGLLMITRHSIKSIFKMNSNESKHESTKWTTPYLSYFSPDFDRLSFFFYLYVLHSILLMMCIVEGIVIFSSFYLSTEKILIDFEIFYILLDNFYKDFAYETVEDDYYYMNNSQENIYSSYKLTPSMLVSLRRDMRRIVNFHQNINRDFRICANNSAFVLSFANLAIMIYGCIVAYFTLTSNDLRKTVHYAMFFILINLSTFGAYHNGQRIFNQNDMLRRSLAELPWTDKPQWFKQSVHIMMTRANVDIEMRPFGIYTLNYMSFKDLMKTAFSVGNIFYTKKMSSQTQL